MTDMKNRFRRKGHVRFWDVEDGRRLLPQKTGPERTEHHADDKED
jgi:hypothetical protein